MADYQDMSDDEKARLEAIVQALRNSLKKTRAYFKGTMVFYIALISLMLVLALKAEASRDRGFYVGVIILLYLGINGMWISPLRGLRGERPGLAGFLNLFRFPLSDRLRELEEERRWEEPADRLCFAEEILERQAEVEKEMRAWPNRMLSLAVITAVDLIIWLVWKNGVMALVNQAIATVVSQVHISLAPRDSMRALSSLR